MHRTPKKISWLTLWALLLSVALFSHAAEAPGAPTVVVKDQQSARPLARVQITLKARETAAVQTLETDEQRNGWSFSLQVDETLVIACLSW